MLCSNVTWYKRILSSAQTPPSLNDLEDLKAAVAPSVQRLPLVAEVILFENGEYVSQDTVKTKVEALQKLYTASKKLFILKLSGKLAPNLATLNGLILYSFGLLQRNEPVLVELSYERLKLLAGLEDSCFLHPRIYPGLKYYIRHGDEKTAEDEIKALLTTLKEFAGIKVVVSLSLQAPWPNIMPLLNILRQDFRGLVRMIEMTLERSPSVMVEGVKRVVERRKEAEAELRAASTPSKPKSGKLKKKASPEEYHPLQLPSDSDSEKEEEDISSHQISSASASVAPVIDFGPHEFAALDAFDLIQHIKAVSGGELDEEDFVPISVSSVLEPFLELVGIGRFSIRPGSHCGLAACFFSTPTINSASVSKYLDLMKFNERMKPLLPTIQSKGIGFFTARSIKKAIKSASKQKLPDLVSMMADSSQATTINEFVDKLQFLVIHNHMDVATMDMSRRCECSVVTLENNSVVASCTGCL